MQKIKTIALIGCAITLSSCATMFGNNDRQLNISTNPAGAKVSYRGYQLGASPVSIPIAGTDIYGNNYITVSKEGFEDVTRPVPAPEFQMVSILNIFNGFGWIIDGVTGNFYRMGSHQMNIELPKK